MRVCLRAPAATWLFTSSETVCASRTESRCYASTAMGTCRKWTKSILVSHLVWSNVLRCLRCLSESPLSSCKNDFSMFSCESAGAPELTTVVVFCFVGQTEACGVRGEESVGVYVDERCCRSGRSSQGRNVNRISEPADLCLSVRENLLPTSALLFAEAQFLASNDVWLSSSFSSFLVLWSFRCDRTEVVEQATHQETRGHVYLCSTGEEAANTCLCVCVPALNGAGLNLACEN